jgi:hypothetical protein
LSPSGAEAREAPSRLFEVELEGVAASATALSAKSAIVLRCSGYDHEIALAMSTSARFLVRR